MHVIQVSQASPGVRLAETIYGSAGQPLLHAGVELTAPYIAELKAKGVQAIYVQDADTADVEIPHPVAPEVKAQAVQNLSKAFEAVATACEGLRKASIETVHQHLQSDRFAGALRNVAGGETLVDLSASADTFLEQLLHKEVLVGLNSIKSHDAYTFQHSIDVTIMGVVLAQQAGWDRRRVKDFAVGCLLHDVGKIFVEPEVLNKAGKLTDDEFARVKAHPALGYQVIKAIAPGLGFLVPQVAYQHHERQDGSGYPRGLRGDNTLGRNTSGMIHDFGSLCAVADVYDAMASDRPYRPAWGVDRVVNTIGTMSGSHLNRLAVELLKSSVPPYPVCSRVRVIKGKHAGCEGVVTKINPRQLDRPTVRLLWENGGERKDAVEVDLMKDGDVQIQSVTPASPANAPATNSDAAARPAHRAA